QDAGGRTNDNALDDRTQRGGEIAPEFLSAYGRGDRENDADGRCHEIRQGAAHADFPDREDRDPGNDGRQPLARQPSPERQAREADGCLYPTADRRHRTNRRSINSPIPTSATAIAATYTVTANTQPESTIVVPCSRTAAM